MVGDYKVAALCTSRIYDLKVHGYIISLNEHLKKNGFLLWVYSLNEDIYWDEDKNPAEASVFDYISYPYVDVVVIMNEKIKSHNISGKIIRRSIKEGKPVVILDGEHEGCSSVRFDFESGFEKVVRHVIEHHEVKKPLFMGGFEGNPFSEQRLAVFKRVLSENGIEFSDDMVTYGDFWAKPARKAMQDIIDSGHIPRAVICANDIMAINACDVLKNAGIHVPEDCIVTGFDGYEEVVTSIPGITTVDCELSQMAEVTMRAVLDADKGKKVKDYSVIPELVRNESCGCPRCMKPQRRIMSHMNDKFYRYQDDVRVTHECVTKMITSSSLDEAVSNLKGTYTGHMCCVVKKACLEREQNFFTEDIENSGYRVIYDPDIDGLNEDDFDPLEIIPGLKERQSKGFPIIIQALDYMDKPMGYVAYYFDSYDITDYTRTANLTEIVNLGLGGYINMQYQQHLLERVADMYKNDSLTGLYNRVAFREVFDEIRNDPANEGKPLLVLMTDLDYLKRINDNLGHRAGDKAIAAVASALKSSCPPDSLCVRFGGDEMLAFIPGGGDAAEILENIKDKLKRKSEKLGFEVSASFGSVETEISEKMKLRNIFAAVDEKMYIAKNQRKRDE
ncbi:MAG: GGDEF domain-containing protein [Lachnospiraceae bacterium]|nr:GGDEF domain-containing protein [Lachnospiraceae bacterium]